MKVEETARLSVVESIYHQTHGEQPTVVESRFGRWLNTPEQPYARRFRAGEEWVSLDKGWVEDAAMLVLSNDEGRNPQVVPSEADKRELAQRAVEIGLAQMHGKPPQPFAVVPPGESARFQPTNLETLMLRCWKGSARVTLTLIPS